MPTLKDQTVCQIAIIVKDIEQAARNYAQLFGVEMPEIIEIPKASEVPVYYRGRLVSPDQKLCVFHIGNLLIELTDVGTAPSAWKEFYEQHGQGVHHFGFQVDDREAVLSELEGMGVQPVHVGYYPTGSYTFVDSRAAFGVDFNIKHGGEDNAPVLAEALKQLNA